MLNSKVSIIIPVYNSEKFLEKSLESAIHQTYSDIEIIAINDGSTDNSLDILKKYSDKINIISQPNRGLAAALNIGIENSNGKWFKWFSPDDILYPDAIETLVTVGNSFSKDTIIYSNWEMIDEEGKELRSFSESNYNKLCYFNFNVRLLDSQQINVNTTLIPITLVKKYGFQNIKDQVAIDYDFFLRIGILHQAKFHLIEKSLVKYRISKNQLSHSNISKTICYLDVVRDNILSILDSDKKHDYISALALYKKNKSISSKIMNMGLNFCIKIFPTIITDSILRLYLEKLRTHR